MGLCRRAASGKTKRVGLEFLWELPNGDWERFDPAVG
jgi:hypothetical protein